MVLVFWRNGLYSSHASTAAGRRPHRCVARPRRGDPARLRDRHGLPLLDLRDLPDRAALHGAADRPAAVELRRRHRDIFGSRAFGGARCWSARGQPCAPARVARRGRGGSGTSSWARSRRRRTASRLLGDPDDLPSVLPGAARRRADRHRRLRRGGTASDRRRGAPQRGQGARRAEDDRAARAAPSSSRARASLFELRPPVFAGADWATKRAFDLFVNLCS